MMELVLTANLWLFLWSLSKWPLMLRGFCAQTADSLEDRLDNSLEAGWEQSDRKLWDVYLGQALQLSADEVWMCQTRMVNVAAPFLVLNLESVTPFKPGVV